MFKSVCAEELASFGPCYLNHNSVWFQNLQTLPIKVAGLLYRPECLQSLPHKVKRQWANEKSKIMNSLARVCDFI